MASAGRSFSGMRQSRRWGKLISDLFTYLIMLVAVLLIAVPFLWMFLTSFKAPDELFTIPPKWLPNEWRWSNFVAAWNNLPMARFYVNTFVVATTVMVLQLVNAALCAYVFVRIKFPGRDLLFLLFLGLMMFPAQVTIIPSYVILSRLKWLDTYWALIIPRMASVFGVFLLRQAFLGVPSELIDAAIIDGAGHLRLLFQVMMPLVRPVAVTLAVLSFTFQWNDYFWPLIMTNSMKMRTLPVGLVFMRAVESTYEGWSIIMAGTLLVLLPILLLFLAAQRYFVLSASRSGLHGV
jgi:ABC-type glycerol-3-phosphate transport system permease component